MARRNWEELQTRFLAEHAETGISAKDWCEREGLKYSTAKAFIKITSRKQKQKTEKKTNSGNKKPNSGSNSENISSGISEKKSTGKARDHSDDDGEGIALEPTEFGLTKKEAEFVYHFLKTGNRVEAYRLAKYEGQGNTAYVGASRLYRKDKISKAIRVMGNRVRERYTAEMDEIVDQLVSITRADPNALTQYRRVNCRFCWGEDHRYQWRDDAEYDRAERKAAADSKPPPDNGGIGFVSNMDPNPDCPRCNGEGEGEIKVADTRDLAGDEQTYFLGVKETKFGLEVITESKQAARAQLLKILDARKSKSTDPDGGGQSTPDGSPAMTKEEYKQVRQEMLDEDDC